MVGGRQRKWSRPVYVHFFNGGFKIEKYRKSNSVPTGVARFFLVKYTKTGENKPKLPNDNNICIPNGRKILTMA
jgi:hypothetical protein